MEERPISALQQEVRQWAEQYWAGEYWPVHANLTRLVEEVGEIARAVNQQYGPKRIKDSEDPAELTGELADALFVILCLANSTDSDLQAAFDRMLAGYREREERA